MPLTPRLAGYWFRKYTKALFLAWPILVCCPALFAQAGGSYLIVTVAGNGGSGFAGDGGTALLAQLGELTAVTVDSSGNIYTAGYCQGACVGGAGSRIREITSAGTINTIAGTYIGFGGDGGPAKSAQLSAYPEGLAVDQHGNVFVADTGNQRIRKISGGVITTFAGNPSAGFVDGVPATSSAIGSPVGLVIDAAGNLYFSASTTNGTGLTSGAVRKVSPSGIITTVLGPIIDLGGLAMDARGNLYVLQGGNPMVLKLAPSGAILGTQALPNFPAGEPVVDASDDVYVPVSGPTGTVIRITPTGSTSIVAGGGKDYSSSGGPATQAGLDSQTSLAIDLQGNIFVAEGGIVRELVPTGTSTESCIYSIDGTTENVAAAGATGSVGVLASNSSCPWLAASYSDWVTVSPSGVSGGTGLVTYTVSPNPDSASRTGIVWIAGKSLTVSQSGVVCSLGVAPRSVPVAASGLTGSALTVTATAPDCAWTAAANVPWILVSGGSTGTGSGTVTFTVGINTGGLRTGTITAAGQKIYVNQAATGTSVSSLASITAPGVVNAATYSPPISPGAFVTVYGQNLADTTTDWSSAITNGQLPTSLAGVQVLVNGKNAFIYYVEPTQVNAVAQPDTVTGSIEVDVITNHGTVPAMVDMVPVSPGLFTYSLQGTLYAAAVFNSDSAYVGAVGAVPGVTSRPAQAGDYIVLFATGLGQTNPPYPAGQVLTAAYTVQDLSKVTVLVGGKPASVLFAGMTYPGLFQINIQVPNGIPAGDQSIVLGVSGQVSLPKVYLTFGGA